MTDSLLLKMAIEIVSFPIKNGGSSIVMLNYQRVAHGEVKCKTISGWWFGTWNLFSIFPKSWGDDPI